MRALPLRHSIGTKIFGAFLAMSAIVAGLGAYACYVLAASGALVVHTYDYPMMAINFARAASVDFLQMENAVLANHAVSPNQSATAAKIDGLAATLFSDLDVAEQRSTADDERAVIRQIRGLVHRWQLVRHAAGKSASAADLSQLNASILDRFDMLIELNADHGFRGRREALTHVTNYRYAVIGVTLLALLLTAGITLLFARRIVRPLSAAASVADRIASGEFQTPIPAGGSDETGALLRSMSVMQRSIAAQVEREKGRANSAEGRLLDALESSGEGVILVAPDGRIAVSNSEVARFFPDVAKSIAPGAEFRVALEVMHTETASLEQAAAPLTQLFCANGLGDSVSAERRLRDGRWIRLVANRTREDGLILFIADFTELKAREDMYRQAKLQAESASAAKSRFLANMSHELRTPLNAIIGFSEVLSAQLFGPLGSGRYVEYANDILGSGRHLLEIINSVLDIAKTESGEMNLTLSDVDLLAVIRDCTRMLREQFVSAGLSVSEPAAQKELPIRGDRSKLLQVLLNLISNAIKFTRRGGTVSICVETTDSDVTVEVRDTGIGMTPSEIETALTPFAQVDNRLERKYDGTGLGLPLAKSLVELHGGSLKVKSTPGTGTSVFVTLPRLADSETRRARKAIASASA